ncbi:hypothetical protein DVH24_008123 [Malus domestica]|uniref:DET1- and DDB1-associated protein 1 domain-containing protein n=1 Tax=Malus domestica TaxID=3750 RepID=A0A498JP61_MALDO|nr:hypothetical protein DVH24_008123 [Malus domestica]
MGSLFGDWPSYNPHNFSQLRPSDPSNPSLKSAGCFAVGPAFGHGPRLGWNVHCSSNIYSLSWVPRKMTPATYYPTHNRTLPPPDQVITNEAKNILLRHMYQHSEEKLRQKRAAPEKLSPEPVCKQQRYSVSDTA